MRFSWKQTLQIDMLASMTSPTSSRDQLLCYILWMALVYTIDDIRDRFMTDEEDSINNHAVSILLIMSVGFIYSSSCFISEVISTLFLSLFLQGKF